VTVAGFRGSAKGRAATGPSLAQRVASSPTGYCMPARCRPRRLGYGICYGQLWPHARRSASPAPLYGQSTVAGRLVRVSHR